MSASLIRFVLALSAISLVACSKSKSETQTVTVTQTQTRTILAFRNTDQTAVTLKNLIDGSQPLAPGSYDLKCDVTWTSSQNMISQPTSTSSFLIRNGLQFAAQSFTAEETGKLTSISVNLLYAGGPTNTASVYIYDSLPAGGATGQPLASETLNVSGTGSEWVTATFSSPPDLQKNTTYYLVVKNSAATDMGWYVNTIGDPYAGGAAYTASSGSGFNYSRLSISDLAFKTTIDYLHSPTYLYSYNGISSTLYTTYPAGQEISIDGGVAGILKFTPIATAPTTDGTDTISILVQ